MRHTAGIYSLLCLMTGVSLAVAPNTIATIENKKEPGGAPLMLNGENRQNKCTVVPFGTTVKVLETKTHEYMPGITKVKVRVLDGPCKGDEGWVLEIHLRKSK